MKRLSLVAVGMAVAVAPAFSINLLSNAGFETGAMAPWFQSLDFGGPENWNVTNAQAHSGSFSATDVGNKEIRQNFAATPTSQVTSVSFWVKNPEVSINFISMYYDDSTTNGDLIFAPNADWFFFDATYLLQSGKNLVGIGLFGYIGGGPAEDRTYVDDFFVEAVPEPTTMSLMTIGLAGFVARRRRRR